MSGFSNGNYVSVRDFGVAVVINEDAGYDVKEAEEIGEFEAQRIEVKHVETDELRTVKSVECYSVSQKVCGCGARTYS
jgi:hypothetical protein